jgi:hypothetical protein
MTIICLALGGVVTNLTKLSAHRLCDMKALMVANAPVYTWIPLWLEVRRRWPLLRHLHPTLLFTLSNCNRRLVHIRTVKSAPGQDVPEGRCEWLATLPAATSRTRHRETSAGCQSTRINQEGRTVLPIKIVCRVLEPPNWVKPRIPPCGGLIPAIDVVVHPTLDHSCPKHRLTSMWKVRFI